MPSLPIPRRAFLGTAALGAAALAAESADRPQAIRPARLRPGDAVGLIDPAFATFLNADIQLVTDVLAALGLKPKLGKNLMQRYGYLAGRDEERASDVNAMFADPEVKAVWAVRGGWGCARILQHLDYAAIRRNPKVLLGYSDVTALHAAIHARTGLVTFHGPNGMSDWPTFTVEHLKRVVMDGEAALLENPKDPGEYLVPVEDRIQTITPGKARGRLLGGNLTVLSALMGSPYLPDFDGAILFLEDVEEEIYRVDRMLTQLKLAGVLAKLVGVVFGRCTDCEPGERYGSLTLEEVLADHVKPLGVPAWQGAMIGHIEKQWTLPIGADVEIDADAGTLRLLAPAVV